MLYHYEPLETQNERAGKIFMFISRLFRPCQKVDAKNADYEVKKIKIVPACVELNDLTPEGRLKVTFRDEIKAIILDRVAKGIHCDRLTKEELAKLIGKGKKPTCGATYHYDAISNKLDIYWVYKGLKQPLVDKFGHKNPLGHLQGKGSSGTVKVLQKDDDDEWYVLKLNRKKDDKEFQAAKHMKGANAIHRLIRLSPSKKRMQEEIVFKWIPGKNLSEMIDDIKASLPPVLMLELINNIIQAMIDFHAQGYIHRDIKPENLIVYLTRCVLIDAGLALHLPEGETRIDSSISGSPSFVDPDIIKVLMNTYDYSQKNDMYALGIILGILLNFIKEFNGEANDGFGEFASITALEAYYGENKFISDKNDCLASFKMIKKLIGDIDQRPESLAKCKEHFQKLYVKALKSEVNACVVDIDEFLSATPDVQARLVEKAAKFPRLHLVGSAKQYTDVQLIAVYKAFEERNLYCDEVIQLHKQPFAKLEKALKKITQKSDPGKKFKFALVTERVLSPEEQAALKKQNIEFPKTAPAKIADDRFAKMIGKAPVDNPVVEKTQVINNVVFHS